MEDGARLPLDESVSNPPIVQNNPYFQYPISQNFQSFYIGNPTLENNDVWFNNIQPTDQNFADNFGFGHTMDPRYLASLESQFQRVRIDGAARGQIVGTTNYQQIPSGFNYNNGRHSNNPFAASFNNGNHHHHQHENQFIRRQRRSNFSSMEDVRGKVVSVAKDQNGSQFLMQKLDERNPQEVALILWEVRDHLHDLMMHSYANQFVKKIFEAISVEQMTSVVELIIRNEQRFVDVCVHTLGTYAMQSLVEHLSTPEQLVEFTYALKGNIIALTKNLNGGYVIQKCLIIFPVEATKEILNAVAFNCIEIATHKDGCSVVQKCLGHAQPGSSVLLVRAIIWCAARLADDPYGNYVVQFVIKLGNDTVNATIVEQLRGKYVELSMNKFASNVVEDLLQYCDQSLVALIIQEIMNSPNFLNVLQNPFGNYVVQGALRFSKGALHNTLGNKIISYHVYLRSHPYGKRVLAFARGCRVRAQACRVA